MRLVDTTAWIEAFRASGSRKIQEELASLVLEGDAAITELVILELMVGIRSNESPEGILKRLIPVHRLTLLHDQWRDAWNLAARLRKKAVTVSASDCIIATVAISYRATLVHCDTDFELIAKHEKNLKTLDWTKLL